MTTPENDRVAVRTDPSFNPAIDLLRRTLSSGKDAEDGFREWRRHPYTVAFLNALAELVDSPPVSIPEASGAEKILVQYGVTSGLSLAYKLLTQPNRVYPEIFRGDSGSQSHVDLGAYTDTQDSFIDQL